LEKQRKKGRYVTKVWHPTVKSNKQDYALLKKQMTKGRGPGILSVELDTEAHAQLFADSLEVITHAVSLGGHESLIGNNNTSTLTDNIAHADTPFLSKIGGTDGIPYVPGRFLELASDSKALGI